MNSVLTKTSGFALAATLLVTLLGTSGSSAAAEHTITLPLAGEIASTLPETTPPDPDYQPVVRADDAIRTPAPATASTPLAPIPPAIAASSLEQLVATQVDSSDLSDELKCLAGAIYFEARSETLEGQLAVGRVVVARTRSGRFPASYCGVIHQPSQFPWARTATIPRINDQSPIWQRAVAMARIADAGSWQSTAEGALFFHTAHVTTSSRMQRVAQIDHHVFYR